MGRAACDGDAIIGKPIGDKRSKAACQSGAAGCRLRLCVPWKWGLNGLKDRECRTHAALASAQR